VCRFSLGRRAAPVAAGPCESDVDCLHMRRIVKTAGLLFQRGSIRDAQSKWRVGAGPVTAVPCRRIASSAFLRLTDPKSIECTSDQVLSAAVSGRPCFRKRVNSLQAVLNFLPMKKIGRRGPSTRSTGFVRYALASARHPRVSPTFSTDGHLIRDAARKSRWGRILVHEVNNSSA
jgi:hypothetical protein